MAHDFKKFPELTNRQLQFYQFSSPHPQITEDFECTVTKVIDGDTIRVRADFRDFDFPLRMLDIDAPEMNEADGQRSKEWVENRLHGETIEVKINKNKRVGKFGRLLGTVFHKGMSVGQEMMFLGLAQPFGKGNESHVPALGEIVS